MVNEWWKFWNGRVRLREAVSELDEFLAIARLSDSLMPIRVKNDSVQSEQVVVFATESYALQALLSSSPHQLWTIKHGGAMRNHPRYSPSDVFLTLPLPRQLAELESLGRLLHNVRSGIMRERGLSLTRIYNAVNDPDIASGNDVDVDRLRGIHVDLDYAVLAAYGWDDLGLDHAFHTYRQIERWTVSPTARVEVLDRLLEENLRRANSQDEIASNLEEDDYDDESEDE